MPDNRQQGLDLFTSAKHVEMAPSVLREAAGGGYDNVATTLSRNPVACLGLKPISPASWHGVTVGSGIKLTLAV